MFFYRLEGSVNASERFAEKMEDRREYRDMIQKVRSSTNEFNQKSDGTVCFVSCVYEDEVTIGVISETISNSSDAQKLVSESFLDAIRLDIPALSVSEVTFHNIENMLCAADRNDFIPDDDEILEKMGIDALSNSRMIKFGEHLLKPQNREKIYETAIRYGMQDTMLPELDRIYAESPTAFHKVHGHPVHYMLMVDDRDIRRTLYRALLTALYDNHRTDSSRYTFVDFKPGEDFSRFAYDSLYKAATGGVMVVRYLANVDTEESEYASSGLDTIRGICEAMQKYRNEVLTVLCLPRECSKAKTLFYENLGNISIVELKEEFMKNGEACDYLKLLAKEQKIRVDKKLLTKVEPDKGYLIPDLKNIFNEWFNDKLKSTVYPQYKEIHAATKEVAKAAPRGSAYDELQQMIGLTNAKAVIQKALNFYKMQKLCRSKGMTEDHPAMHMVFTGNPGSAKTTVARLFAEIMKENGVLSRGHLVEVGRSDLVGKYVGWTAKIVKEKFQAAKGGVLFIDEAYALSTENGGSFGQEAIDTIVQEMENCRQELIVIFAGYPKEMEKFLQSNPGLRSRIAFHVPFDDYNADELTDIAKLMAKNKGLTITEEALEKIHDICEDTCGRSDFGNGRFVRNVLETAKMNQATRLLNLDFDSLTAAQLTTICAEDIESPIMCHEKPKAKLIGFAG